jgi:hypothetical protein
MIRTVERKRERETARRSSYKSQQRHSTRHCMAWVESISGREGPATAHASQQEHTQRAKTQDTQKRRSAGREKGRGRETTLPVIRLSSHRLLRSKWPFFHPPHRQVETRRTARRVGTLRRRPGETGGRGGRYLPHQPARRPGESVGLVVDTRYLPPHSRRRWPGEPVGARVRTFCWGALPLTPGPEFEWLIYPSSK